MVGRPVGRSTGYDSMVSAHYRKKVERVRGERRGGFSEEEKGEEGGAPEKMGEEAKSAKMSRMNWTHGGKPLDELEATGTSLHCGAGVLESRVIRWVE